MWLETVKFRPFAVISVVCNRSNGIKKNKAAKSDSQNSRYQFTIIYIDTADPAFLISIINEDRYSNMCQSTMDDMTSRKY